MVTNCQALVLLSACKAGLITSVQEYPNLSPEFKQRLVDVDTLLVQAVQQTPANSHDQIDAINFLKLWKHSLRINSLDRASNLTIMVAMSLQCVDFLLDNVAHETLLGLLTVSKEQLEDINGHLHEGMSDKALIPKFEKADSILSLLYNICGIIP